MGGWCPWEGGALMGGRCPDAAVVHDGPERAENLGGEHPPYWNGLRCSALSAAAAAAGGSGICVRGQQDGLPNDFVPSVKPLGFSLPSDAAAGLSSACLLGVVMNH